MAREEGAAGCVLTSQARQDIGMVPTKRVGQMSLGYPLPWLPGACPELEARLREEQSGGWGSDEQESPSMAPAPSHPPAPAACFHSDPQTAWRPAMRTVTDLYSLAQLLSPLSFPDPATSDLCVTCIRFASFILPICIS